MKQVLITGANSYIGTNVERWLIREPDKYKVDTIDMIDGSWRNMDFSGYDVIFHVAGIVHVKETRKNEGLFYSVNRDLAIETAQRAKNSGISQFIFLSSMSVYGLLEGVIDLSTIEKPNTAYGKSKYEAERSILSLNSNSFKVAIIRPPMVYGKGCRGNYSKLVEIVHTSPIFPVIHNRRSMIYIINLCEFIKLLIDNSKNGIFFPQNDEYVDTVELVKLIAEIHRKRIIFVKIFNPLIKSLKLDIIKKSFGNLLYHKQLSSIEYSYNIYDFVSSIKETEIQS